jgi:hypothetical protein
MILSNGAVGLSPAATAGTIIALKTYTKPVPVVLYDYLINRSKPLPMVVSRMKRFYRESGYYESP